MQRLSAFLWRWLGSWLSSHRLSSAATRPAPAPLPLFSAPGRKFLHVGCGWSRKAQAGMGLQAEEWVEIRLDIDADVHPDIVASMLDMASVPASAVDAVYSSHNIEHLYPHEVIRALGEFHRVLKPEGIAIIGCPDLEAVCAPIADGRLTDPLYISAAGNPISPLDILYGHRESLAAGNLYMAHHTGFTQTSLMEALRATGFAAVAVRRCTSRFDLWAVAAKSQLSEAEMANLADLHLPRE